MSQGPLFLGKSSDSVVTRMFPGIGSLSFPESTVCPGDKSNPCSRSYQIARQYVWLRALKSGRVNRGVRTSKFRPKISRCQIRNDSILFAKHIRYHDAI